MGATIEPLQSDQGADFTAMLAIYQASIEPSEQKPPAAISGLFRDPRYHVLVSKTRGTVDGFLIAFFPEHQNFWLLEYMAVIADGRSKGTGAQLFAAGLASAQQRRPGSVCVLEVDVPAATHGADSEQVRRLDFYARQGCRRIADFDYILPLAVSGTPPPMQILLHGRPEVGSLPKAELRTWMTAIYRDVYDQLADDPRIDTMLSHHGTILKICKF